jgi:hypothetical protein
MDKITVGAIRWDGWFNDNEWQRNLNPPEWHHRLPFYGREISEAEVTVCGDSQEVLDQEIAYARLGGLDYWAFLHYHVADGDWREGKYNYGLKLYLQSRVKDQMGFCVIIYPHSGDQWEVQLADLLAFLHEPTYHKVCDGRPLIYMLLWGPGGLAEDRWGDLEKSRAAIDRLRAQVKGAGFANPYLVALTMEVKDSSRYVDQLGLDGIGTYANWSFGSYQDLAARNRAYWEECKAAGKPTVPILNAGWDPRPRYATRYASLYGEGREWAAYPTPGELADHVKSALDWIESNPKLTEPGTILIYAWNETDEGSWLAPTLSEGAARLEAIGRVLLR